MTTWLKDKHGNKCSVEHFGSEAAAQKALDSLSDCTDCSNCHNCKDCINCRRCSDCDDEEEAQGQRWLGKPPAADKQLTDAATAEA